MGLLNYTWMWLGIAGSAIAGDLLTNDLIILNVSIHISSALIQFRSSFWLSFRNEIIVGKAWPDCAWASVWLTQALIFNHIHVKIIDFNRTANWNLLPGFPWHTARGTVRCHPNHWKNEYSFPFSQQTECNWALITNSSKLSWA